MPEKRTYDSTVARIAGNIASGLAGRLMTSPDWAESEREVTKLSVRLARAIVKETERTESGPEAR